MLPILINALRETLYMVLYASLLSTIIGIPLGMFMASIANNDHPFARGTFFILYHLVQIVKAIPYLIVMLLFVPITNWLINHQITYTTATIVPLSVAGTLLLAQNVFDTFVALNKKWHTTTKSMGASSNQTVLFILLPESLRSIIEAAASTASTIVGFSIIAGAFGSGGLGQLAIEKTITEPNFLCALISIVTLLVIQQVLKYTSLLFVSQKTIG